MTVAAPLSSTSVVLEFMDSVAVWCIDVVVEHHLTVLVWLLLAIGALLIGTLVARGVRFVVTQFFRRPYNLIDRYGADSWAVISGSSGGIGLGFAVELAKRGFHIVVISRSEDRLKEAEQEVRAANPRVHVKRIVADFARCGDGPAFWDHLMSQLHGLDVSILVNNVGINHTESFATVSETFLQDIVHVNCTSQIIFTRRLIGQMLERTGWRPASDGKAAQSASAPQVQGRRSAIISVSSVAGQRPLLYLSSYSATKAFNDFFSRALALEFPDHLDVLSLRPGYVVSNMSKLKESGGFVLDRYECARGCLEKLGYVSETYGDPRHAVYARSFFLLPDAILAFRRRQRLEEKNKAIEADLSK